MTAGAMFLDVKNCEKIGLSNDNIALLRELTDFLNVSTRVTNVEAVTAPLEALATTGLLVRTGTNAYTTRSVTGTSGHITVADGDGVAGAPTLSLPNSGVTAASYTFTNLTVDAQGRITTASNGDVAAALLSNLGGDPNADRILFWDDSAGAFKFLTVGTNLTITATTIDGVAGSAGALTTIEQKVADGTQNSYTFSAIPGTYTDLVLVVSGRSTSTSGQTFITVNGLTTSIYDRQRALSQSTTLTSDEALAASNWANLVQIGRSGDTAGFVGGGTVEILGYAQTSLFKPVIANARVVNSATTGNGFTSTSSGQVRTTDAITSVTVAANTSNNWATGSLLTLYGRD